jgi:hypothetical protein
LKLNQLNVEKGIKRLRKEPAFFVFLRHMEATVSKAKYDAAIAQINALKHQLDQLRRLIFASKSERFAPASAPEQMELFEQGADAGAVEV